MRVYLLKSKIINQKSPFTSNIPLLFPNLFGLYPAINLPVPRQYVSFSAWTYISVIVQFRHQCSEWVYPLKFVKVSLKLRHYIPLIFVLTLPVSIWPYILVSLLFSWKIATKEKDAKLFFALPVVFFVRHFVYGLGSLFAIIKLAIGK